jgi:hypothetical protein
MSEALPLQHGLLHVSGAAIEHGGPSAEAFGVVADDKGDLSVVLIDAGPGEHSRAHAQSALRMAREALSAHAPIYEVVGALRNFCACERQPSLGVVIVRFSQPHSRVELLNAGMPAVTCVLPNGRSLEHAPLSAAIGQRFTEVHPYELSPLSWGSTWYLISTGLMQGKNAEAVRSCVGRQPPRSGAEPLTELTARLVSELPEQFRSASLLAIHSDPRPRFQSSVC